MEMDIKTVVFMSILILAIGGVATASATTVTLGSKTFTAAGDTGNIDIILDSVPNGLSGYSFNITISNPAVAEITGITKPSWHEGLWSRQVISSSDNTISVVDIDQTNDPANPDGKIVPGATNVNLATVNLRAKSTGTATITLANRKLDSDRPGIDQGIITATLIPGTLVVSPPVTPTAYGDKNAIFRPSTGYWYFDFNMDGVVNKSFRFGGSTDQIMKGNWTGSPSSDPQPGIGTLIIT
jgi:hypothetical protein